MYRVGIVGCGSISQVHAWVLRQLDSVKMVAVADIVRCKAAALAGTDVHVYETLTDMLRNEKLDVVHICTPHYLHVPMAMEALQNKVSVFCEKPPAVNRDEWERLKQVYCEQNEITALQMEQAIPTVGIGYCFQNRYNAATRTLEEIVKKGTLGRVIGGRAFVTWKRDAEYYAESPWKGKIRTEGGGVLMNQSIHTLDLLLSFLGKPATIAASLQNHHTKNAIEVEDTVEARMEFEDGKRACFYASNGYGKDAPVLLELEFEKGRAMIYEQNILLSGPDGLRVIPCTEKPGMGKTYWGSGHLACISDYYHCMEQGLRFRNDLKGVENTVLTTLQIYGR